MAHRRCKTAWSVTVLAAFLLAGAIATAQEIAPPQLEFEKYELPNGLDVILHEDHSVPIVAVNLWYHVGSKNEEVGHTGFAHLFEHMMFQGSQHHDTDVFEMLDRIGSTDRNGTTNFDRTNYFENVPTNALERTLWLESDRMGWLLPSMTQERLDNQREVVKNERRQGVDNQPYGTVDERMYKVLYPATHPYSWDVIGYMDDLTAASKEDVENFFKHYYGPNNCTLSIAGDIDVAKTKEMVEKYFGPIPPSPPIYRQEAWVPELTAPVRLHLEDRVPLPRLYIAWHMPGMYQDGDADLEVLGNILSEGKNSRLYKKLVYEMNVAQDVRAFVDDRELSSLFWIRVTAKEGESLDEIERLVMDEVEQLRDGKPTKTEVDRARTEILAGKVRGLQRIGGFGGKSDVLARYNTYTGDPGYLEKDFARYQAVTPASVQATTKRWLHEGRAIMQVVPYPDLAATPEVASLDRDQQPDLGPTPELSLPTMQHATLSNGLKVILAESHKTPVVQINLMVGGGWSADQHDHLGVASFTSRMMDEGTTRRSALDISGEAQDLGAELASFSNLDGCQVRLNALTARLEPSLDLWADVCLNPSFPQKEIDFQRKQVLGQITQEKRQPVGMGLRILPGLLFGPDHPYGQPLTGSGTEASVRAITRDDLVAFHDTWFKPNNATVVVVGDVTLNEMVPALEKVLGGWKAGDVPKIQLAEAPQPDHTTIYIIDKPEAAQTVLMAGHLLPPRNDPRTVPFEVLNTALGGQFTSRINMNLREDKGYTYGAFVMDRTNRGQGALVAFTQVRTDVTKESLHEIMKELTDIRGPRPITQDELDKVQNNLTLRLPGQFESLGEIAGMIGEIVTYDLPEDYHTTYPDVVRSTTTEGLTEIGKELIHPDKLVVVAVGDRKVIEPKIAELDLGPIHYLDANGKPLDEASPASR